MSDVTPDVVNPEVVDDTPQGGEVDYQAESVKFQSLADKRLADADKYQKEAGEYKGQVDQWNEVLQQNDGLYDHIQSYLNKGQSQPETQAPELDPYSDKFGTQLGSLISDQVTKAIAPIQQNFEKAEQARAQALAESQMRAGLKGLGLEGERADKFLEFVNQPKDKFELGDLVTVFNTLNPAQSDIGDIQQTQQAPASAGAAPGGGTAPLRSEVDKMWEGIKNADNRGKII